MQNVAPTRRLNRRSSDLLLAAALVFLLGAAMSVAGIVLHIFSLVVPSNDGYDAYDLTRKALLSAGIGIAFVSLFMALRAVSWKTDNALAWQLGELLAERLDRQFVFIRNISKGSLGAIDAALLSKHGVSWCCGSPSAKANTSTTAANGCGAREKGIGAPCAGTRRALSSRTP